MASLWQHRLQSLGWSETATVRFIRTWAPTTLHTYSKSIEHLLQFLHSKDVNYGEVPEHLLAEYLCAVADTSERPHSVLNTLTAAISCFCEVVNVPSWVTPKVFKLITGLVKSGTSAPLQRSRVMPVSNFKHLFLAWEGNYTLPIDKLRLKCITLLAITIMLRPSDIAPRSQVYDSSSGSFNSMLLTTNHVVFHDDGSMSITLHGIKNDYDRHGFEVNLPPATTARLCPVRALRCYIQRMKYYRPSDLPLFLSLKEPYQGITAKTVATVLNKAIRLAGLKNEGFSAKHFRPTGATTAVQNGISPDFVMRVSWWRSRDTFERHYVHAFPSKLFTENILT